MCKNKPVALCEDTNSWMSALINFQECEVGVADPN